MKAFYNLNPHYDAAPGAILAVGKVGWAPAKLTSMGETLKLEQTLIRRSVKEFLRCGNPKCVDCGFSWEGLDDSLFPFLFCAIRDGRFKSALKAILYKFWYRYPF